MELTWIRDVVQVDRIARNLLSRLKDPQRLVELLVPSLRLSRRSGGLQVYGSSAIVGGLFGVEFPAKGMRESSRYGTARYGQARYARTIYPAIYGSFYAQEITHYLKRDITKLLLRQYID